MKIAATVFTVQLQNDDKTIPNSRQNNDRKVVASNGARSRYFLRLLNYLSPSAKRKPPGGASRIEAGSAQKSQLSKTIVKRPTSSSMFPYPHREYHQRLVPILFLDEKV